MEHQPLHWHSNYKKGGGEENTLTNIVGGEEQKQELNSTVVWTDKNII